MHLAQRQVLETRTTCAGVRLESTCLNDKCLHPCQLSAPQAFKVLVPIEADIGFFYLCYFLIAQVAFVAHGEFLVSAALLLLEFLMRKCLLKVLIARHLSFANQG